MKRDMDLVREILLQAEELSPEGGRIGVEGKTIQEISYHLFMMEQSGLVILWPYSRIVAKYPGTVFAFRDIIHSNHPLRCYALTWQGHDFLDTARNPDTWKAAK